MSGRVDGIPVAELAAAGLLTHPSAEAEVVERRGVPGTPDPARVITSRVLGGFEHEVIASRGLDIGHTTWRGVPISWRSPVRDARALDRPAGTAWLARFTGGLLTTCGPFSIGDGDAEHGLHGEFSHLPAAGVTARISGGTTTVTGTIAADELFGPSLSIERSIVSEAGDGFARLRVTDDIRNTGPVEAGAALLYHVNIGPPVAVPGSVVGIDADTWRAAADVAEVPDPFVLPPVAVRLMEAVFEHVGVRADVDGWSRAVVGRPGSPLSVEVAWRPEGLPHANQWVHPTAGRWAFAIEPSSAPLFGPGREAEGRGAPRIAPGASRRHEIMITVRESA